MGSGKVGNERGVTAVPAPPGSKAAQRAGALGERGVEWVDAAQESTENRGGAVRGPS